ncbi:hypothetical protein I4U23_002317 [Adineta vaga]|nr:hypothetical protein I4U23_002317 [Adineta vaga]
MNRIDEEEDSTDISAAITSIDQFPSVQPSPQSNSDSIYSSKQSSKTNGRSKDHSSNRPTSLSPTRHTSLSSLSSPDDIPDNVKQRRRYASDSTTNHIKNIPASLVISFLRHLRNELRATSNKNNGYHHVKQTSLERSNITQILNMNTGTTNENPSSDSTDNNEILTLIDLLVLRVECLANEAKSKTKKKKVNCPSVAEVDQNLIEYLYYLFTKFLNDEANASDTLRIPIIDKNNFVNVCQTLVRNGCFDIPPGNISISPDQSSSETTSSSDKTLSQHTLVREYHPDTDTMMAEKSSLDGENLSTTSAEQETWLVVDLEATHAEDSIVVSERACQLTLSPSNEQLLISNDNYRSFESESTPSVYLSPDSSSFDLLHMVQEPEENNNTSVNQDGLSSTNVITESKPNPSNDNICTGLANNDNKNHSPETSEPHNTNSTERMSRRERKRPERWSISTKPDTNDNDPSSTKTLLTVEFPPIAVLRRKTSPSTVNKQEETIESTSATKVEEINTSPTLITVNTTNPDQIVELSSEGTTPLLITIDDNKNILANEQLPLTESEVICLSADEIITSKEQGPLLSTTMECHTEIITTINNDSVENQPTNIENSSPVITNPSDSDLMSSFPTSHSPPRSSVPSTLTTDENKTIESLSKENGKEKIEEEQRCNDDYNIDEEKKNTSSLVHDYHAEGILLINDEPTQTALLHQEKKEIEKGEEQEEKEKERPSSPLPTLEQFNQQRTEDESPLQTLSNDLNQMAMANTNENEELYKKVEIEEIPDDEEEIVSKQNVDLIEPTDYILTDDEPKKSKQSSPSQSNSTNIADDTVKFDNVFTCYEKAMSKVVDKYDDSSEPSIASAKQSLVTNQEPANDPIALRALQRFEERMNAVSSNKTSKDDTNPLVPKGKSSWSTSLSTSRKSLENLLKDEDQQLRFTAVSSGDEIKTGSTLSSSQANSHIRPRKTFDDSSLNYGTILNLYSTKNSTTDKINHDDQKSDKEQQPSTIIDNDDKRIVDNNSTIDVDSTKDQQNEEKQQELVNESINSNGINLENEEDNSNLIPSVPNDDDDDSKISSSFDAIISQSSTTEQSGFTPYHFQIEGRRRLNTVERMRERQSRESSDAPEQQQQQQQQYSQIQHEYTLKPEEVQDPIIRRALERFDEKNRTLAQTKSVNYDEIQDPITRRALMRLESNLKRSIPPPPPPLPATIDSNENWYTESYTLGSLQPTSDRVSRYTDSSQLSTLNNKAKYMSSHQRYGTSADPPELSTSHNFNRITEQNIPVMRVPAQPIYVTSSNLSEKQDQQQQQPLSLRQRSRSEDMLASKDLTIGQTTNLDEVDTSNQLQRNRSSNEIALKESNIHLPNTLIKTLEPHFVRTTESSVTYATPTQSYSAYSCEYTRPRRNVGVTSSETSAGTFNSETNQLPPRYPVTNDIQHAATYRPSIENQYQTQPSSAFAPVRSAATTTTGTHNYYSQQALSTPSYGSFYTSNNPNQTQYSEDPIVRRALERFNSQVQNSLLSTSHYLPTNNYSSHQGTFQDNWPNSNRSTLMTTSTSSNSSAGGYQSIIGRRRQTRHDDLSSSSMEHPSVGDAYSSSIFNNSYSSTNQYMNMPDEPPAIPPRFRRENHRTDDINDQYRRHSIDEYHSENININNNNNNIVAQHTHPRETFIHHAYPATITNSTGFRPIDIHYNQQYEFYNHLSPEQDDLQDHIHSPSSVHSSDSSKQQQQQQRPIRPSQIRAPMSNFHRLPPPSVTVRTSTQQNGRKVNEQMLSNKISPDDSQSSFGQSIQNNGNVSGDSVFHRLAYTGTKASLSKSSSNSCSNLLNKTSAQGPSNHLKSCEIELDESTNVIDTNDNSEQISALTGKCQRSKSVDGRARLKIVQARSNNNQMINDHDENDFDDDPKSVPSSKFIPINGRRDGPPPRVPLASTSGYRTSSLKRPTNGTNIVYNKDSPGIRTQSYNGGVLESENQQQEIENDENISYNNDNYQQKTVENRTRTAIPVHRYTTNNGTITATNHIQPSLSTSSVSTTTSRIKPPTMIPVSLEKRDSNSSTTDITRTPRRTDEQRRSSPPNQRRNVPVSVFSPAKLDNKRPAPAPPTYTYESQQQLSYPVRIPTTDTVYSSKSNEHEIETKISSTNSDPTTSTANMINEFTISTDKHDNTTNNNNPITNNKKMNVFERLFRGNKKKN